MTANPIPDYTVNVDENGVLAQLVKQPYDNSPSEDRSGCSYSEKFKGPYETTKEVLSLIKIGDTITQVHTTLSSNIGLTEQISYPACPARPGLSAAVWRVTGIRVEECEAGAHCNLYLDYSNFLESQGESLTNDPWQDVWTLQWQSYSVDPYNFASNEPNQPYPCSPSFDTDPENAKPPQSWNSSAMRAHIDQYLNTLPESKTVDGKTYYYYTPDPTQIDSRYFLNDVEAALMKKKQLGRSATYHYPILTHITVKRGGVDVSYTDELGGNLDHIVSLPSSCPYKFPANAWTWVKIGDDMTQQKVRAANQTVYTRREMFAGFTAVDENFYGNGTFAHTEEGILSGRWELEKL